MKSSSSSRSQLYVLSPARTICKLSVGNSEKLFGGKSHFHLHSLPLFPLCVLNPELSFHMHKKKKKIEGKYFARSALCFRWRTQLTLSRVIFANLRKEEERRGENVFDKSLTRKKGDKTLIIEARKASTARCESPGVNAPISRWS